MKQPDDSAEGSLAPVDDEPGTPRKKGRPRGRPVGDREAKRMELLSAGISTIAQLGYAGASLRKVAERAGYTTGAVTYYFENKEAMFAAITEYMFDEFDALLQPAREASNIKRSFELWLERMSKDSDLWLVQFQMLAYARSDPTCASVFQRRYVQYRRALTALLEEQQAAGKVRDDILADLLADQLSAMGDGWMMMLPIEPERFMPKRLEALLDAILTLLAPVSDAL